MSSQQHKLIKSALFHFSDGGFFIKMNFIRHTALLQLQCSGNFEALICRVCSQNRWSEDGGLGRLSILLCEMIKNTSYLTKRSSHRGERVGR